jgi:hypothetical protein
MTDVTTNDDAGAADVSPNDTKLINPKNFAPRRRKSPPTAAIGPSVAMAMGGASRGRPMPVGRMRTCGSPGLVPGTDDGAVQTAPW